MRMTTACAAALAGALVPGTALAQDMKDDWYVAAAGTISMLDDSHTKVLNLPIPPVTPTTSTSSTPAGARRSRSAIGWIMPG